MYSLEVSKNKLKETAKLQQKKYRDETGLFIAEGEKALEELLESNIEIEAIYSLKEKDVKYPLYIVNKEQMKKISSTDSPCSILTVAKKRFIEITTFKNLNKLILIDSVSDPGNLGTIIRSAAAFGVEGIILYGNCTDLYSPKVIRSTAGNFFKVPIINIYSIETIKENFNNHIKIATSLSDENNISIKECAKLNKYIIMFGSEANGLNENLINTADKNLKIEMKNNVESLNLAVTSSIIMYELG